MNLAEFIGRLDAAGVELDITQLCDAMWLATRGLALEVGRSAPPEAIAAAAAAAAADDHPAVPRVAPDEDAQDLEEATDEQHSPAPAEKAAPGQAPVFPALVPAPGDQSVTATPVTIAVGRALANRLAFMRAFRPLCQRWPSRHAVDLDEEGTIEASTQGSDGHSLVIQPVFLPRREQWFDVELVLEDDDAIEIWNEKLRDFSQVLRDTGAFRSVRSWRLRMPARGDSAAPMLESEGGNLVSTRQLAGQGMRRLIFLATHGASSRWVDGSYAGVLERWRHGSSIALLQMTPAERWTESRLGDPQAACSARHAGAPGADLEAHPFWWGTQADVDTRRLMPLPVVGMDPRQLDNWSRMQMARGRQHPAYLLDPADDEVVARWAPTAMTSREVEDAVNHLRHVAPDAFQLGVWLSPTAFTIPVARMVCATQFGEDSSHAPLKDLLLSGVLTSTRPPDRQTPLRFDFRPAAREILLRSLRDIDAKNIARELRNGISKYIGDISGPASTAQQLVPYRDGNALLPAWAQPFADVAAALVGTQPATIAPATADPPPDTPDDDGHAQQDDLEDQTAAGPVDGMRILWVDDRPENNQIPESYIRDMGADIVRARTTVAALAILRKLPIDIIISDMARGNQERAGMTLLRHVLLQRPMVPVIIFSAGFAKYTPEIGLKAGAFGVTNSMGDLLRLVQEAATAVAANAKWADRVGAAIASLDLPPAFQDDFAVSDPGSLAKALIAASRDMDECFLSMLRVIQHCSRAVVSQVILNADGEWRVAREVVDNKGSDIRGVPAWDRLVVASTNKAGATWHPDVGRGARTASPRARSALLIPVVHQRQPELAVAVVNIEIPRKDGLSTQQIAWMAAFVAPLARIVPAARPVIWLSATSSERQHASHVTQGLQDYGLFVQPLKGLAHLNVSDTLLIVMSKNSVQSDGRHRTMDVTALSAQLRVILVVLDDLPMRLEYAGIALNLPSRGVDKFGELASMLLGKDSHRRDMARPERSSWPFPSESEILYATNRLKRGSKGRLNTSYSSQRIQALMHGYARVSIPPEHRIGRLERPAALKLQFSPDRDLHVDIISIHPTTLEHASSQVASGLQNSVNRTFLFIPGAGIDFEEGLLRCATTHQDLRIRSLPVLFSWAHKGGIHAYYRDADDAELAAGDFLNWLRRSGKHIGENTDILAIGLGARLLCSLVEKGHDLGHPFGHVVLVQPDLEIKRFESSVKKLVMKSRSVTVYVSKDELLKSGESLAMNKNAGSTIHLVRGVETISASRVTSQLSTAKFNSILMEDMRGALSGRPANTRSGNRTIQTESGIYWKLGGG